MKFYCSADEFYFCKIYSLCRGKNAFTDESKRITKSSMIKVGILFVSVFVLGMFSFLITEKVLHESYKPYANVMMAIVVITIFINVFVTLSRLGKEKEHLYKQAMSDPLNLSEQVMIYEIDDEGIFFNEFNNDYQANMTLIPWEKIKNATVGPLTYPAVVTASNQGQSTFEQRKDLLEGEIQEIRKIHNDFDYPVQLDYEDKRGIHFYFHNGLYYEYLAVPACVNEKEFLSEISKHVPVEFGYGLEPMEL